jgi:hypothetical protein
MLVLTPNGLSVFTTDIISRRPRHFRSSVNMLREERMSALSRKWTLVGSFDQLIAAR